MSKIVCRINTQIKDLKEEIIALQHKWSDLYCEGKNNDGDFNTEKMDEIVKEIEWAEYLLWGARNGILR